VMTLAAGFFEQQQGDPDRKRRSCGDAHPLVDLDGVQLAVGDLLDGVQSVLDVAGVGEVDHLPADDPLGCPVQQLTQLELGDRPVRPWLFAVACNLLTDLHRANGSRPQTAADDTVLATVADGADEIERAVESWTMAEALRQLSEQHREVLVQAHWLGRSVAETARVLGVPPGTVKSRTYYAIRALRLILEEMGLTP